MIYFVVYNINYLINGDRSLFAICEIFSEPRIKAIVKILGCWIDRFDLKIEPSLEKGSFDTVFAIMAILWITYNSEGISYQR